MSLLAESTICATQITLLAECEKDLQKLLHMAIIKSETYGLHMNTEKFDTMVLVLLVYYSVNYTQSHNRRSN